MEGLDEPAILENIQGAKFCPWGKKMGEAIPKESEGLMVALHGRPFTSFPFHEKLLNNLAQRGLHKTTIIQDLFLLPALRGKDIVVQARRGSGKALGYILVLLERLLQEKEAGHTARSIVLVTEEDRAQKLSALAQGLAEGLKLRASPFAAQDNLPEEQLKALEQGAELIFTTPYWLNRALKWRLVPVNEIKIIVLDELEDMVRTGPGLLENILRKLPPPGKRQGLIFMAEPNYTALEVAYTQLSDPEEIFIETGREEFTDLSLQVIHVSAEEKFPLLLGILKQHRWPKTLLFVNNKVEAQKLCDELKRLGLRAVFLKPDLGPEYRLRFLKQFAGHEADLLVATDAGCRFIHQNGINLLINYDLPETGDDFRHRAAKVARGGKIISFCDETGAFFIEAIEKDLGQKLEVIYPEPEEEWFLSPELLRQEKRPPVRHDKPSRRPVTRLAKSPRTHAVRRRGPLPTQRRPARKDNNS